MRGGELYRPEFGERMRGRGDRWKAFDELFEMTCRRLGLNTSRDPAAPATFRRPGTQLDLIQNETGGE